MLGQLPEAISAARDVNTIFTQNKPDFEDFCGGGEGSLDNLEVTLLATVEAVNELEAIATNTTELLLCEDINQIWIDLMHDAVCTSSPKALAYMFGTMVAIYVVGMFIFLFRGALVPEVMIDDGDYSDYSSRGYSSKGYSQNETTTSVQQPQDDGTQTYNLGKTHDESKIESARDEEKDLKPANVY